MGLKRSALSLKLASMSYFFGTSDSHGEQSLIFEQTVSGEILAFAAVASGNPPKFLIQVRKAQIQLI